MSRRSAMYVDGFNLYHAIKDLNEPFLKWCNLWSLGELVIPSATEKLVKVSFYTAYYPGDSKKRWRHDQYINALRIAGVDCVFGHYVQEPAICKQCGDQWKKPTEKETDINVALHLMSDAYADIYDTAYLLTADSDQAATARMFRSLFPDKEIVSVSPPHRNFSTHITAYANRRVALNRDHIERCLFSNIEFKAGLPAGRRPHEYAPPPGWVAPHLRPK